jgi:hypothetical protein
MISSWWLIPAAIAGFCIGFMLLALVAGRNN